MRLNTSWNSSGVCAEVNTRCSVWQPTQLVRNSFCLSVPGALISHSAFESWPMMLRALASLRSALAALPAVDGRVLCGHRVARRAHRDLVFARAEPVGREAVIALVVGDDRDGDGRAFLLGVDQHALHVAFLGRGDGPGQRGVLRLGAGGKPGLHQHGAYADAREQAKMSKSHRRFLPRLLQWFVVRPGRPQSRLDCGHDRLAAGLGFQ